MARVSTSEFSQEARSKIKVIRNAKGDPQWEITVIAGEDDATLATMREQAVKQHQALLEELAR